MSNYYTCDVCEQPLTGKDLMGDSPPGTCRECSENEEEGEDNEEREDTVMDEGKSDKLIMFEAMEKAREAFKQHFSEYGLDAAFFDLKMEGFMLDTSFEPTEKVVDTARFQDRRELEMPKLRGGDDEKH